MSVGGATLRIIRCLPDARERQTCTGVLAYCLLRGRFGELGYGNAALVVGSQAAIAETIGKDFTIECSRSMIGASKLAGTL